ncbi:MAG: hypothetical protein KGQ37_01540 [Hyphomicrobiales bacterium]|nr:hypothetical protein [Hyphomicrobiales bacterium]
MKPAFERTGWPSWVFGTLCLAGIVHLASVLMLPHFTRSDALAPVLTAASAASAPQIAPQGTMTGDPNVISALCRFDLSEGPLRIVSAVPGDEFMSISFHETDGPVYFSVTDQAADKGQINLVLGTRNQIDDIGANDDPDHPSPDLRVVSPHHRGYVLFHVLISQPDQRAGAQALLAGAVCRPDSEDAS